jgi:hypothetical protein
MVVEHLTCNPKIDRSNLITDTNLRGKVLNLWLIQPTINYIFVYISMVESYLFNALAFCTYDWKVEHGSFKLN